MQYLLESIYHGKEMSFRAANCSECIPRNTPPPPGISGAPVPVLAAAGRGRQLFYTRLPGRGQQHALPAQEAALRRASAGRCWAEVGRVGVGQE